MPGTSAGPCAPHETPRGVAGIPRLEEIITMTPHQRLGFLAARLRQPLPEKTIFNMSVWRRSASDCHTAACAFGLASMQPELQAEGLTWVENGPYSRVEFGGQEGYSAAAIFFGITFEQTEFLFNPDRYEVREDAITPAMVADRIDIVVAQLPAETAP
jgi:hypothetical protein